MGPYRTFFPHMHLLTQMLDPNPPAKNRPMNILTSARRLPVLLALSLSLPALFLSQCQAEIVIFDLGSNGINSVHGQTLHGSQSGTVTATGSSFSVSMSAATLSSTSAFNLVSQGMAINSKGPNQSNQIDATLTPVATTTDSLANAFVHEGMKFKLSGTQPMSIAVRALQLEGVTQFLNDGIDFINPLGNVFTIDHTNVNSQGFVSINQPYLSGEYVIRHAKGNGFRIRQIVLDVKPLSAPEPGSFAVFGILISCLACIRRRK